MGPDTFLNSKSFWTQNVLENGVWLWRWPNLSCLSFFSYIMWLILPNTDSFYKNCISISLLNLYLKICLENNQKDRLKRNEKLSMWRACQILLKKSFSWKIIMGNEKMESFDVLNMGNISYFHLEHSNCYLFIFLNSGTPL